jgi:hypothetical protein
MAAITRSDSDTARTIFYVVAILMAIYGLALLVFPQAMFTLSDDPGGAGQSRLGALGWGICLGHGGSCMACCQHPRKPTASHDGVGHSLHPGHPGFAL